MTKSKHTPGPWTVGLTDDLMTFVNCAEGEGVVCKCDWGRPKGSPRKKWLNHNANARLIAAAPELLESSNAQAGLVAELQAVITEYLVTNGLSAEKAIGTIIKLLDGPEQRRIQTLHDAAIAKATGEAS